MMGRFLYRVFFWTYERGSWQWDISCLVFILIIFTTPADFLMNFTRNPMTPDEIHGMIRHFFGLSA